MNKFIKFFSDVRGFFVDNHKLADFIFTLIILFVSITSFFHVVKYWTLTNKAPFYYITAIATELIIIGSMMAIRYTRVAWVPFFLGIVVQAIGNIFYSYMSIEVESTDFIGFMELFKPMFELNYGDELEVANYKRVLAYSNGLFYLSPIVFLWAKMSLNNITPKSIIAPPDPVVVAPTPVVTPDPVVVAPTPVVTPDPVVVAPTPVVTSDPVVVAPTPVVTSDPVVVAPTPVVTSDPEKKNLNQ